MAATALRRLFVNWYTKTLQVSDLNGAPFALPAFNKYETVPLEIVIVEPDLSAAGLSKFKRVSIANLSITVCINDSLDTATPIATQGSWSKDSIANVFSAELALNTSGVNTYLGSSASKPAYFEIEMQEGTARSKIYLASVILANSVAQAGVIVPSPAIEYLTVAQASQQYAKQVMDPGQTLTLQSPDGLSQRVLGIDNGVRPIDQALGA